MPLYFWNLDRTYSGHFITRRDLTRRQDIDPDDVIDFVEITEGLEQTDLTIKVEITHHLEIPTSPTRLVVAYLDPILETDTGGAYVLHGPYDVTNIKERHNPERLVVTGVINREFEDTVLQEFKRLFINPDDPNAPPSTEGIDEIFKYDPYKYWDSLSGPHTNNPAQYRELVSAQIQSVKNLADIRGQLSNLSMTIRPTVTLKDFKANGDCLIQYGINVDSLYPRQDPSVTDPTTLKLLQLLRFKFTIVSIPDAASPWITTEHETSGYQAILPEHEPKYDYDYDTPDLLNYPGSATNRMIAVGERKIRYQYSLAWHGSDRPAHYLPAQGPGVEYVSIYIDRERWKLKNTAQAFTQVIDSTGLRLKPNMVVNFFADPERYWRIVSLKHLYGINDYRITQLDLNSWGGVYTKPDTKTIPAPVSVKLDFDSENNEWKISWRQEYSEDYIDRWEVEAIEGSTDTFLIREPGRSLPQLGNTNYIQGAFLPEDETFTIIPGRRPDQVFEEVAPSMVSHNGTYRFRVRACGLYGCSDWSSGVTQNTQPAPKPPPPKEPKCEPVNENTAVRFFWDPSGKPRTTDAYLVTIASQDPTDNFTYVNQRLRKEEVTISVWDNRDEQPSDQLKGGITYTLSVKAVDKNGITSDAAVYSSCMVPDYPTLDTPKNLKITYGNGPITDPANPTGRNDIDYWSADASWDAVTGADSYETDIKSTGSPSDNVPPDLPATPDTAINITTYNLFRDERLDGIEMNANTTYEIRVRARNNVGVVSDWSAPVTINTTPSTSGTTSILAPYAMPGPLTLINNKDDFTFTEPNPTSPRSQYAFRFHEEGRDKRNGDPDWSHWFTFNGNSHNTRFMDPGKKYNIRVVAINSLGSPNDFGIVRQGELTK